MTRVVTVTALLVVAAVAGADDAKKLLKELEGSYVAVSETNSGDSAPADFIKTVSFSIKGVKLTVHFKKGDKQEAKEAMIVVDPSQMPVAIDITPKDGKPVLGIIKIEKDMVTICCSDRRDKPERPKEFKSTKDDKHLLIVMKKK